MKASQISWASPPLLVAGKTGQQASHPLLCCRQLLPAAPQGSLEIRQLGTDRGTTVILVGSDVGTSRRPDLDQAFGGQDADLVFTTGSGYPVELRNLARSFRRIAKAASLRPIRLHG